MTRALGPPVYRLTTAADDVYDLWTCSLDLFLCIVGIQLTNLSKYRHNFSALDSVSLPVIINNAPSTYAKKNKVKCLVFIRRHAICQFQ